MVMAAIIMKKMKIEGVLLVVASYMTGVWELQEIIAVIARILR